MNNDPQAVLIDYTNHAGARQVREIRPIETGLHFGSSPWHPDEQWLLTAWDFGKQADRTFAVRDIHDWAPVNSASGRATVSIVKQLQGSMERNGRMVNRLRQLLDRINNSQPTHEIYDAARDVEAILKDEDI